MCEILKIFRDQFFNCFLPLLVPIYMSKRWNIKYILPIFTIIMKLNILGKKYVYFRLFFFFIIILDLTIFYHSNSWMGPAGNKDKLLNAHRYMSVNFLHLPLFNSWLSYHRKFFWEQKKLIKKKKIKSRVTTIEFF